MINTSIARGAPCERYLTGIIWNVNGIGAMGDYIKELAEKVEPNIMLLSDTKRRQTVDITVDLACDPQKYRVIQLNSTVHHRGGFIVLLRNTLRVETAELVRIAKGEEFIQAIVVEDREGHAMVFWYSAPKVCTEVFGETVNRLLTEYNVKVMMGDLTPATQRVAHATTKRKKAYNSSEISGNLRAIESTQHASPHFRPRGKEIGAHSAAATSIC